MKRAIVIGTLALAGCNSTPTSPVIPDETIYLTNTFAITYAELLGTAALVGVTYLIVDPLAPNWEVTQTKLADNRWRINMRKKDFTTGGDGEAVELLRRHAEELAETQGYRRYQVMAWTEGVQSDVPFAHRWGRGEVELREPLPPMPSENP
jgi:hypothetical protein